MYSEAIRVFINRNGVRYVWMLFPSKINSQRLRPFWIISFSVCLDLQKRLRSFIKLLWFLLIIQLANYSTNWQIRPIFWVICLKCNILPYKLDTLFYWESASSLLMKIFQISLIAPLVLWDINSREM